MSATDFEYAIKKDVRNNPIVREVDEARQRQFVRAVAIGGLLVAVLLFSAWQHFELVQHGYLMERLQQERAAEEEINRHLKLEIATLRAPRRIEDMATRRAAHGAAGGGRRRRSSSGWRLRRRPPSPSSRLGSRFGTSGGPMADEQAGRGFRFPWPTRAASRGRRRTPHPSPTGGTRSARGSWSAP